MIFLSRLSDTIEEFIKSLLTETEGKVEIQRNELADYFSCAPSQINYVLATRFTLDRGYCIESRRGGGGYIRVIRIDTDKDDYLLQLITKRLGDSLSESDAHNILSRMEEQQIISKRESAIMKAAVQDKSIPIPSNMKDMIRARIFKAMILSIMNQE